MVNMDKIITVVNRSPNQVVYRIPDTGVRRTLRPNEPIRVTYEEMVKLSYRDGGRYIIDNFLQITDSEIRDELQVPVEVEYNYTANDILRLFSADASLDEFLDCLDFAPAGVINMVKQMAVEVPLKDLDKREALKEKFGLDVTKAVEHRKEEQEDEPAATPVQNTSRRRVQPAPEPVKEASAPVKSAEPERKTNSKYTIISKKDE